LCYTGLVSLLDFVGPENEIRVRKGKAVRLPFTFPDDVSLAGSSFRGAVRAPYGLPAAEFDITVDGQDVLALVDTADLRVGPYLYEIVWVDSLGDPNTLMSGPFVVLERGDV
jgi:hypothetical protein